VRSDLRRLSRSIRRAPATALAAVLTLALTIGAGASIFAVVDAVLLTPPPFAEPAALAVVGETPLDDSAAAARAVRYATFEAWRERAGPLAALEAFDGTNLTLTGAGVAERVSATDVTPGFLSLLGVVPARGRSFRADDAAVRVAIVSAAFWHGKLASDPAVVGRQLVLNGRAHTIVGVLPERFVFALNPCDIWRPIPMTPAEAARTGYRVAALARLAPGVSTAHVASALDDVSRRSTPPARTSVAPVATVIAGDSTRTLTLLAAAGAVAVTLAFVNLAGLLVVRSIDRRRELAVRTALGAGRFDIVRQVLVEAVVLVAAGSVAGVLLASWTTPTVGRLALQQASGLANRDIAVSWRVIGPVASVAFAFACACAVVPALAALRSQANDVLRRGATPAGRELLLRRVFVAGEVALAFVLLISMALVGRTMIRVLQVSPGFDPRGVLTLQVSLPAAGYPNPARVAAFYSTLQGALQQRLGADAVSIVDELPLTGDRGRAIVAVGPGDPPREAVVRAASPGYFEVMHIPIAAGRSFTRLDDAGAPTRIVISQSLAQRLFGADSAVGRRVRFGINAQPVEIVGVSGDVKHRALDEPLLPTVYVSALQSPSPSSIVVVRSTRPDADVTAVVREEAARLDANLPIYGVRRLEEFVGASPGIPARRLLAAAFTGFALLAVVLSAIGLFGVAAHDVASRRTELALRMALGADPFRIVIATLRQGAVMVGAGLAAGAFLSLWTTRGLGALVISSTTADLVSAAAAAAVLVAASAAAVFPAALRAARTDPMLTLRGE
jgi:putative ABC transport system permease protein